jgi:16S rRNA (guanine(966)-N(2))-methyltransferase RsmD
MRIVSGSLRGRLIQSPKGRDIRPTGEKVRAAIFNTLYSKLDLTKCTVADICCGTGALGIEALSRGAQFCTFVDTDTKMVSINVTTLELQDQSLMIRNPAQKVVLNKKADVIFLDPPYYNEFAEAILKNAHNIGLEGSVWVVEVESKHELEINEDKFDLVKEKTYGHSKIYILEQKGE